MTESVITGYHYDSDNFFYDGTRVVQKINGVANYPKYVLENAPALKEGYWYKCTDGKSWTAIAKPTTCSEAIKMGLSAISNSPKQHAREVCSLLQSLVAAESEEYRIKTDSSTLEMSIEAIPEKTFEEVKAEKEAELESKSAAFENTLNKDMYFTSSVGFRVNGDRRTRSNIEDLITHSPSFPVTYRDYDNQTQKVTQDQLKTMLVEHITNGNNLYVQKWAFEEQINACTTVEELKAIDITFKMMDFSE